MHRIAPRLMENALAAILMGEFFSDGLSTAAACYRLTVMERRSEHARSDA